MVLKKSFQNTLKECETLPRLHYKCHFKFPFCKPFPKPERENRFQVPFVFREFLLYLWFECCSPHNYSQDYRCSSSEKKNPATRRRNEKRCQLYLENKRISGQASQSVETRSKVTASDSDSRRVDEEAKCRRNNIFFVKEDTNFKTSCGDLKTVLLKYW